MNLSRSIFCLAALLALSGCAGGWREGAGPGNAVTAASGGGNTATPAASSANAAGTHVAADGVVFVWKGGGGSAAVAGEFNAWNTSADAMTKQADGSFRLVKKLEPGRYAYKFVVDGSNWKEDPNAKETVDDGYGGKNAIVVVGGAAGGAASPATPAATAAAPAAGSGKAQPPQVTADGVRFSYGGGARTVHLAGDFNGWSTTTDPLVRGADGTWTVVKKLSAGTHGYKFVIDGTTWKHDEANPQTGDDGYGGKNSLVTVP